MYEVNELIDVEITEYLQVDIMVDEILDIIHISIKVMAQCEEVDEEELIFV